jgi:hypothetical protein
MLLSTVPLAGATDEFRVAINSCCNYLEATGRAYEFDGCKACVPCLLTKEASDLREATWCLDFADSEEADFRKSMPIRYYKIIFIA